MAKTIRKDSAGVAPPHSIDMEKNVLGCILVDTSVMGKISDLISVDTFYHPQHQLAYEGMLKLFKHNNPIDYTTLIDQLTSMGKLEDAGGADYIRDLTDLISASNYEVYARAIEQKAIARRTISICNETQSRIYENSEDIFVIVGEHNDAIFKAQSALTSHKNVTPEYVGGLLIEEMERGRANDGMVGVPSGVPEIDEYTGGWQPQHVITIGARTRHGKSALAAGFLYNASSIINPSYGVDPTVKNRSSYPGAFLSMEMRNTEVYARLVSMEIKKLFNRSIAYSRITKGRVDDDVASMVLKAVDSLSRRGIYIDDTPALNPTKVKAKVMKMISDYGIKFVIIDYIQLVTDDAMKQKARAELISGWYTDFKNQAKFFNIPYIILSQIDRATEKQQARRPVIADLKDSGGIEERSDVIVLAYRPEVNEPHPVDEMGRSLEGIIITDIAKNKQGSTGVINLPFDVATNTFGDVQDFESSVSTFRQPIQNDRVQLIAPPPNFAQGQMPFDDEAPF